MFAITLDNDKYIESYSSKYRKPGSILVEEIPDETDLEKLQCYQYIDNEFVFDADKWAAIEKNRAELAEEKEAETEEVIEEEVIEEINEVVEEINETLNEINSLKAEIATTDYQIIKCYEYSLIGLGMPYDIEQLHADRQTLRDRINELESTL